MLCCLPFNYSLSPLLNASPSMGFSKDPIPYLLAEKPKCQAQGLRQWWVTNLYPQSGKGSCVQFWNTGNYTGLESKNKA